MFCLLGMTFAFGPMGMGANEDVPVEVRAEFMQATHEGDYETATSLHEEYGLGGKRMEHTTPELFELGAKMFQAQASGNWVDAVGFQDQIMEMVHAQMQEMRGEMPKCEEGEECEMRKMRGQREMPEGAAECKAALEANEDALAIKEQIHEAIESEDHELAKELHEQLKEMLPEECKGMQKPRGMRGQGMHRISNTE